MAWIEKNPDSGEWKVSFRWKGKKYRFTKVGATKSQAEGYKKQIELTLWRIKEKSVAMPLSSVNYLSPSSDN